MRTRIGWNRISMLTIDFISTCAEALNGLPEGPPAGPGHLAGSARATGVVFVGDGRPEAF